MYIWIYTEENGSLWTYETKVELVCLYNSQNYIALENTTLQITWYRVCCKIFPYMDWILVVQFVFQLHVQQMSSFLVRKERLDL